MIRTNEESFWNNSSQLAGEELKYIHLVIENFIDWEHVSSFSNDIEEAQTDLNHFPRKKTHHSAFKYIGERCI